MGKKGKKTRWRRLPIGGTDEEGGLSLETPPPTTDHHRITFNEDEYTKITTPRQDVLFKKGYFGRKRTPTNPSPVESQEAHSGESVENESYVCEEPQFAYPTGYMDPSGVYYVSGNTFETYDPYTGTVTVVVGPPAQYPGGAPVLAALPCQPVPLQPVEWFNPPTPWCYSSYNRKKRYSTDSQNCSAQSSESTGPPGSPQEPVEEGACAMYPPQYMYPGYMFGPPIYNMNGVTVQGMIPQPVQLPPDMSVNKRRKKRRRRRRGGVTDDGSESSCCEEPLTCDVPGCQSENSSDAVCQSGASSDAGAGPCQSGASSDVSSKANSDSGINTDPTPNSGSNSPPLMQVTEPVHECPFECHRQQLTDDSHVEENKLSLSASQESNVLAVCSNDIVDECATKDNEKCRDEVVTPEVSEELSTAEDDVTPNLCAAAPEFSSQESTLSCLSTPSATRDLSLNEQEICIDVSQEEEVYETCQSISAAMPEMYVNEEVESFCEDLSCYDNNQSSSLIPHENDNLNIDLTIHSEENDKLDKQVILNLDKSVEPIEELIVDNIVENEVSEDKSFYKNDETGIVCEDTQSSEEGETSVSCVDIQSDEEINDFRKELDGATIEVSCTTSLTLVTETPLSPSNSLIRISPCIEEIAPVPPPRRKRSMCRAAERVATRVVEEAIKEGIEEATSVRLRGPLSITEAVTRWLNSQGSSPLTCPDLGSDSDDDEGIEVGEGSTDQKNVQGNPFLVSFHSDAGQRVAKDCISIESSAGEWDMWDHSHTREMCDPTRSVDKYYRLGADDGVGDKVPPSVFKTAMHIRHTGPFPCGVCCIIQ